jgi:CHASE2 domain-containing sensor protein
MGTFSHPRTLAPIVTVLIGWSLAFTPVGGALVRWSYDLPQVFLRHHHYDDLVIIYMDQQAMDDYHQPDREQWDRAIHVRLIDRLTKDRPRVVVLDLFFSKARDPGSDGALAQAIRSNGRVVLAADLSVTQGDSGYTITPPLKLFETNAVAWGTAKIHRDPDWVGRRYYAGDEQQPGLAWAAAEIAGAVATRRPERRMQEEQWLNYYGSARPFARTSMTYTNAETMKPGFFHDKAVFIGGQPETLSRGDLADVFATPFTWWTKDFIPGVEVTAVAYANLMHNEWLVHLHRFAELGVLLVTGWLFGYGLQRVPRRAAFWVSVFGFLLLAATGVALTRYVGVWFSWGVAAGAQIPCALLFQLLSPHAAALSESPPESIPAGTAEREPVAARMAPSAELAVADHTLIRCIGEGAYGQVWIARNAIGLHHAVKVVYQNRFGTPAPYDRAFRGIQKFMPISRSHEGFVHVLQVGRNDSAGHFYYVMEAADDQRGSGPIDPASYVPKTLATELRRRQAILPRECLRLMLNLAEAVDRLHQHQLIHRDIKPANIIFVNDYPKLADIDLVTDLAPQGEASRIGTEGYLAPEGPGSASADVFSLGRVLYVALTGKGPDRWPELPTRVASQPDCALFMELSQVVGKACEIEVTRRYPSAARMHADLLVIAGKLES